MADEIKSFDKLKNSSRKWSGRNSYGDCQATTDTEYENTGSQRKFENRNTFYSIHETGTIRTKYTFVRFVLELVLKYS